MRIPALLQVRILDCLWQIHSFGLSERPPKNIVLMRPICPIQHAQLCVSWDTSRESVHDLYPLGAVLVGMVFNRERYCRHFDGLTENPWNALHSKDVLNHVGVAQFGVLRVAEVS